MAEPQPVRFFRQVLEAREEGLADGSALPFARNKALVLP